MLGRDSSSLNKFEEQILQLAGSESCINPDLFSLVLDRGAV